MLFDKNWNVGVKKVLTPENYIKWLFLCFFCAGMKITNKPATKNSPVRFTGELVLFPPVKIYISYLFWFIILLITAD